MKFSSFKDRSSVSIVNKNLIHVLIISPRVFFLKYAYPLCMCLVSSGASSATNQLHVEGEYMYKILAILINYPPKGLLRVLSIIKLLAKS